MSEAPNTTSKNERRSSATPAANRADGIDDDEIRLAPPQCASRAEFEAARVGWKSKVLLHSESLQAVPPRGSSQFSLRQLLLLTTLVSIGLGGGALLSPQVFALLSGVLVLASLFMANFQEASPRRSVFLMTMLVYVVAATSAVVRMFCVE